MQDDSRSGDASLGFAKTKKLLKPQEFRNVYDNGFRVACPFFAAFCRKMRDGLPAGTRFGFTTPRALGKAHDRNRLRRRIREAVRLEQHQAPDGWDIVFNPRRAAAEAPFGDLQREVLRVFQRCAQWSSPS